MISTFKQTKKEGYLLKLHKHFVATILSATDSYQPIGLSEFGELTSSSNNNENIKDLDIISFITKGYKELTSKCKILTPNGCIFKHNHITPCITGSFFRNQTHSTIFQL